MVWFKVDDQFWGHPKIIALPPEAIALWVRAGSYCGDKLTDGVVSHALVRMLGHSEADAQALVEAGLWDTEPQGYVFHDWEVYQPTREEALALKAARSEAGKRGADKRWHGKPVANAMASAMANGWQNDAPSPIPSPIPNIDQSVIAAAVMCINNTAAIGLTVSLDEAQRVAADLLSRATSPVARPAAYVRKAIVTHPAEIKSFIENMRPSKPVRRAATCSIHDEYPLPCSRCAEDKELQ